MKKVVLSVFAMLVLLTVKMSAQNGIVAGYCNQGATQAKTSGLPSANYLQGVIPGCTVTIYYSGTITQVPGSQIFSDNIGTVLGNPFTANTLGAWQFWASSASGYDVVLSGGNSPNNYIFPVTLTGLVPMSNVIVAPSVNGVVFADAFAGADVGAKINNAVAYCVNLSMVCMIQVAFNGTISTSPDLPVGFSINFVPEGQYTLSTHWVIYHRGTSYYFNGAHFAYTLDDGLDAFYVGKQTASVVNTSGTTVTWVSGSDFSHIDVGDQILIDSGSVGPNEYNVATVTPPHSLTVTSSAGTNSSVNATFYMTAETALGSYPGKASVIHDLDVTASPATAASVAFATELTSGVTMSGFSANNFINGYCLTILGAITGNYYDIHCNVDKYGLLIDQNHLGTFFGSQGNANRFYGLDIVASQISTGYAFNIDGGAGNLLSGLRVEGNLDHTVAKIQQIAALGYSGTHFQSGGNEIDVLDWERNGDSVSGAVDLSLLDSSNFNIISGGGFESSGGTFTAISVGASTQNNVIRDTACTPVSSYTNCYTFASGATGNVYNVSTGGFTSTAPAISFSTPGGINPAQLIVGAPYSTGLGANDIDLMNTACVQFASAANNVIYKALCTNNTSNVVIDPNNQGTSFGGNINLTSHDLVNSNGTLIPAATIGHTGTGNVVLSASPTVTGMPTNSGYFLSTVQTAQIITADWSCGTGGTVASCTTAQTIGTLSFTLPLSAQTWSFQCDGVVGQATGATANTWSVQTATNGATNVTANYMMGTAATAIAVGAVTDQSSSTTAFSIAPAWTLGATGTKMPFRIWGTIEGASASGTVVNIQLTAPTVGDLVTIYRGASCRVF